MKPIRHPLSERADWTHGSNLADDRRLQSSSAWVPGRGHRLPMTLLHLTVRDHFLRAAAETHCGGMSGHQAAAWLHTKLARYRECAWQRDRIAAECPRRLYGRVEGLLWAALKCADNAASERTLRRKLSPVYSWPTV
jgi:hypothetical protein